MNIGTATPTAQQQEGVPHHLINSIPPTDRYHVGRFTDDAVRIADDIRQRGKTPLFVGGTMMYFHALLNGLSPIPPISDSVWREVSRDFVHRTPAELHDRLRTADPLSAGRIAANDRQRIHRALCVYLATGKPLSEWQNAPGNPFFRLNMIRLIPARRENLRAAISQRLRKMWKRACWRKPGICWSIGDCRPKRRRCAWSGTGRRCHISPAKSTRPSCARRLITRRPSWPNDK